MDLSIRLQSRATDPQQAATLPSAAKAERVPAAAEPFGVTRAGPPAPHGVLAAAAAVRSSDGCGRGAQPTRWGSAVSTQPERARRSRDARVARRSAGGAQGAPR